MIDLQEIYKVEPDLNSEGIDSENKGRLLKVEDIPAIEKCAE